MSLRKVINTQQLEALTKR